MSRFVLIDYENINYVGVKEGQAVEQGQQIAIVEAMKMQVST